MKRVAHSTPFLVVMGLVIVAAVGFIIIPNLSTAKITVTGPGSIWTTNGDCGDITQDANHYNVGEHVFINGKDFTPNTSYAWDITGKPGGASNDPGIQVAGGNYTTDGTGAFCFDAYTVLWDDGGEYGVSFADKSDNYQVDDGKLEVNKQVDLNGDGDWNDTNEKSNSNANTLGFRWGFNGFATDRNMGSDIDVANGSYSINENSITGYKLVGWYLGRGDCEHLDGTTLPANVTVDDHTVTITLCNEKIIQPKLTVIKNVDNKYGGTKIAANFNIHITGTAGTANFAGAGSPGVTTTLIPGTFNVTEDSDSGYSPSMSGDCSGTLNYGDNKTCTITNHAIQPKLTVTKALGNQYGDTKTVNDFPLFVGATAVTSGVQNTFDAGTYTVSETNQTGYEPTFSGDCDSEGSVTLGLGEAKTCTITNNGVQPKLTVIKEVSGGTKTASDFPLFVDDTSVINGEKNGFNVGTYQVSETNLPHYTASFSRSCIEDGFINLGLGDDKTCTITNTYVPFCGDGVIDTGLGEQCDGTTGTTPGKTACSVDTCQLVELNPILGITKSVDKTTANMGDTLTYTITASNTGTGDFNNLVVSDTLPTNTTLVAGSFVPVPDTNNGTLFTWNVATLAAGQSKTFTFKVTVNSGLPVGTTNITNTAVLNCGLVGEALTSPSCPIQQGGQPTTPVITSVTIVATPTPSTPTVLGVETPTLTLAKTVSTPFANAGDTVTYMVTVKNTSTTTAENVVLTDTLPTGFVFADTKTTTATWNLGNILGGQSIVKNYQVKIDSAVVAGNYKNTATVKATDVNPISAQATLEIREVKVLGAEDEIKVLGAELPDTSGGSLLNIFSGLLLVGSGFLVTKKIR